MPEELSISAILLHFSCCNKRQIAEKRLFNLFRKSHYVARYDVHSYYDSIDHKILLGLLNKLPIGPTLMQTVIEYVQVPDTKCRGTGIVAGGALSTLLGAIYLSPLDEAMQKLYIKGDIFYIRYVDDVVILAKTRWKLKKAIKLMYQTIGKLKLKLILNTSDQFSGIFEAIKVSRK